MKLQAVDRSIAITCIAGILISTYVLYVEMAVNTIPGYKALCDISEHTSCSHVLSSEFAKGFGIASEESPLNIPNAIYGVMFYCLIIFLSTFHQPLVVRLQFFLCLPTIGMCVYLAYLLVFVLEDLCVVCVSTYIINIVLTSLSYKKMYLVASKNK